MNQIGRRRTRIAESHRKANIQRRSKIPYCFHFGLKPNAVAHVPPNGPVRDVQVVVQRVGVSRIVVAVVDASVDVGVIWG